MLYLIQDWEQVKISPYIEPIDLSSALQGTNYNHQTITYSRLVPNFQQRRTIPKCRGPSTVEMFGEASRLSIR